MVARGRLPLRRQGNAARNGKQLVQEAARDTERAARHDKLAYLPIPANIDQYGLIQLAL